MTTGNDELAALVQTAAGRAATDSGDLAVEGARPVVMVCAGVRWFAIDAGNVREVVDRVDVSRVPYAPSHVYGLALVHGRLVPVVALEHMLGGTAAATPSVTRGARLVVVSDGTRELAVSAGAVKGIVSVSDAASSSASPERAAWVACELRWNELLVGMVDVARFIDAATSRT